MLLLLPPNQWRSQRIERILYSSSRVNALSLQGSGCLYTRIGMLRPDGASRTLKGPMIPFSHAWYIFICSTTEHAHKTLNAKHPQLWSRIGVSVRRSRRGRAGTRGIQWTIHIIHEVPQFGQTSAGSPDNFPYATSHSNWLSLLLLL